MLNNSKLLTYQFFLVEVCTQTQSPFLWATLGNLFN